MVGSSDARRAICAELFINRNRQPDMQEGIRLGGTRVKVVLLVSLRVVKHRVIPWVPQSDIHHHGLDACKRATRTEFSPRATEFSARLIALGSE